MHALLKFWNSELCACLFLFILHGNVRLFQLRTYVHVMLVGLGSLYIYTNLLGCATDSCESVRKKKKYTVIKIRIYSTFPRSPLSIVGDRSDFNCDPIEF